MSYYRHLNDRRRSESRDPDADRSANGSEAASVWIAAAAAIVVLAALSFWSTGNLSNDGASFLIVPTEPALIRPDPGT